MIDIEKDLSIIFEKLKSEKGIYVIISNSNNYNQINKNLLIELLKKQKLHCLYVSLNKRRNIIKKDLQNLDIDISNIYFIDGVSTYSSKIDETKDCMIIKNINSLTEISLTITAAINNGYFDFIFFDSLNTLFLYHEIKSIEKFIHYLFNKFSAFGIIGIIISSANDETTKIMPLLVQISNKVINLE